MKLFSVVFQDFVLLPFSLAQNVASSNNYDAVMVTDVLARAGFGNRLKSLANGINTPLYKDFDDSGVELSGGEAQLVVIARALYKNTSYIILDEPTAALDPITEYEIYMRFNDIAKGRTCIFISHRMSACCFSDKILVFNDGELVQFGGHNELLADEEGKYHELWNAQAQFYTS